MERNGRLGFDMRNSYINVHRRMDCTFEVSHFNNLLSISFQTFRFLNDNKGTSRILALKYSIFSTFCSTRAKFSNAPSRMDR